MVIKPYRYYSSNDEYGAFLHAQEYPLLFYIINRCVITNNQSSTPSFMD